MKHNVPSSTNGRNASCCALLKRCTSSRNRTVRDAASRARALRLLNRGAHVLDAGHHRRERDELRLAGARRRGARASSCRYPAAPTASSNAGCGLRPARRSGLPGASRCAWPTNSSRIAGRMRSASGRPSALDGLRALISAASHVSQPLPPGARRACRGEHRCPRPTPAAFASHVARSRPSAMPVHHALQQLEGQPQQRAATGRPGPQRRRIEPGEPEREHEVRARRASPCRRLAYREALAARHQAADHDRSDQHEPENRDAAGVRCGSGRRARSRRRVADDVHAGRRLEAEQRLVELRVARRRRRTRCACV